MFYPAMLNLKDRLVSVVGGGEVALRKINTLLEYESKVRVISPEFSEGFNVISHKIEIIKEAYSKDLIADSFLVMAATSSRKINLEIGNFCKNNKILCNIADDMELSDIIIPSSVKRGSFVVSVSTLGKSPALAAKVKRRLEKEYSEDYGKYLDLLGDIRNLVQENCKDIKYRKKLLNEILDLSYEDLVIWKKQFEGGI